MTGNFGFGSAGSSPPGRQTDDILVENHDPIFILRGLNDRGHACIEQHCSTDGYQPLDIGTRLIEHRYIGDIVAGALADGLELR